MSDLKSTMGRERAPLSKYHQELSLAALARKTSHPERSSDPYNTSGSFDRTKNWARVGKR